MCSEVVFETSHLMAALIFNLNNAFDRNDRDRHLSPSLMVRTPLYPSLTPVTDAARR